MNKLIFSNVILWERHLSEMLEIFLQKKIKIIFLLSCNEYFYSCPANNYKKIYVKNVLSRKLI